MKTFTLDEANALLPTLERLLRSALESRDKLQQAKKSAQELIHRVFLSGGMLLKISDLMLQRAERDSLLQRLKDTVAEIDAIGVQVKDLDIGLLDFPCKVDGEIVLLCWKLGEPRITHWHGLEEGFKGRKPIDDRIAGKEPELPN